VFLYHLSCFDSLVFQQPTTVALSNFWLVNSWWSAVSETAAIDYTGLIIKHSHVSEASADVPWAADGFGYDLTTVAASVTDDYIDQTATWKPKPGGNTTGRWALADASVLYDAAGTVVTSANAGFLGPLVADPPSITSVSPSSVSNGASGTLTFTGTGFIDGATVSVDAGLTLGSLTVTNSTTASCTYTGTAAGTSTVTITNPDGQTDTITVEVTASGKPPIGSSGSRVGGGSIGIGIGIFP
jgi:hypothetical protein